MIPLFKPHIPQVPEIDSILHSGAIAFGKYGLLFEERLCAFLGVENLITTNTFNTAISVALESFGIKPSDEVILSPMACLASTQPYHSYGLKIIWADVDCQTGTLDPADVRKRITAHTKLIVHNHFCGYPGHMDEINAIGKEFGIPVFDDGIECFGSEYKGTKIGATGADATIFSFNAVRIPTTIDGGAVIFKDKAFYYRSVLIRDCGIDRMMFRDEKGEINSQYDITVTGYSATMSDVNAYIGCCQMLEIDALIAQQRKNAKRWCDVFQDNHVLAPLKSNASNPNYWVFGGLAKDKANAIDILRKNQYFASGVHINNNRYSVFGNYAFLAGVEAFNNHFVAVPSGWWVNTDQIKTFKEDL